MSDVKARLAALKKKRQEAVTANHRDVSFLFSVHAKLSIKLNNSLQYVGIYKIRVPGPYIARPCNIFINI